MNNNNKLQIFKEEKEYITTKLKENSEDLDINALLTNTNHPLHNKAIKLDLIRLEILQENLPYLRKTLIPFIDSRIISSFKIQKDKIDELVNDNTGETILKTLDNLSDFELKLVELTTKVNLDFYRKFKI